MLGFSALVAGSFSLGAIVANDIAPQAITAARFVFATIVMGMVAALQRDLKLEYLSRPWRYFVLGGLFTFYFVLMFEGLKTANPVSAAAVFTLMPLMSAVFGWWLLRQVTTSRMALALGIAACGALWVIFRGDLAAMMAFDIGPRRDDLFLRLYRPCAIHPDGSQVEPGRGRGCLHLRHAGRWFAHPCCCRL